MIEKRSELKLAANRRNALRSTGPRTPEGKARVARNGLRHGLFAKDVVLRSGPDPESPAEYEALVAQLTRAMQPQDPMEQALVDRIAQCLWRAKRVHRQEVRAIDNALEQSQAPVVTKGPKVKHLEERLSRLRTQLARVGRRLAIFDHPELEYGPMEEPEFHLAMFAASGQCDPPRFVLRDEEVFEKATELARAEYDRIKVEMAECESLREQAAAYDGRRAARRQQLSSLPTEKQLIRLSRYDGMLDRQLHRALAEFRRRRKAMATANVSVSIADPASPQFAPQQFDPNLPEDDKSFIDPFWQPPAARSAPPPPGAQAPQSEPGAQAPRSASEPGAQAPRPPAPPGAQRGPASFVPRISVHGPKTYIPRSGGAL